MPFLTGVTIGFIASAMIIFISSMKGTDALNPVLTAWACLLVGMAIASAILAVAWKSNKDE